MKLISGQKKRSANKKLGKIATPAITLAIIAFISIALYRGTQAYVIRQAELQIKEIHRWQRTVHNYLAQKLRPAIDEHKEKGEIDKDLFSPEMMSSSFIIRSIHEYLNEERTKEGRRTIYYKMASVNPRNPLNKADEFEQKLITMFNADPEKKEFRKIIAIDGKKYLYLARPFLKNTKACLKCHGAREEAPKQLQERYRGEGGFDEKLGEIRAIESIRSPIGEELAIAHSIFIALMSISFVLFGMFFVSKKFKTMVNQRTRELQESEEKFRSISSGALDGIAMIDSDGKVSFWNQAAERMFGYSSEELLGKSLHLMLTPRRYHDDYQKAFSAFQKSGAGEAVGKTLELTALRKDGSEFPVELSVSALRLQNQWHAVGIIRDITERKQAEEKIKTSLKEKELLLKEIHHRVKNNMQVISSILSLQSSSLEDEKAVSVFMQCQDRIKSMAIVHEKLYQSENLSEISFQSYTNTLAETIFRSYSEKAEKISLKLDVEDILLDVDTVIPIGLILNELVTNSLKHAFEGQEKGEIKITFREIGEDKLELKVGDNGTGIPEGFDLRNTDSLGLKLVFLLAEEQLKGKVDVNRNDGTEFQIIFQKVRQKR